MKEEKRKENTVRNYERKKKGKNSDIKRKGKGGRRLEGVCFNGGKIELLMFS